MVQWQKALFGMIHDLGSSPRSYKFPYYFSKATPMRFSNVGVPYAFLIQAATRPTNSNQRRGCKEHATLRSTHHTRTEKVNGPQA